MRANLPAFSDGAPNPARPPPPDRNLNRCRSPPRHRFEKRCLAGRSSTVNRAIGFVDLTRRLQSNRCPPTLIRFGEHLRLCFSVRIEIRLLILCPRGALLRAADVPVGAASLQHGAQVEAQFLHCRPAEEPVAVIDLVDAQARLEHQRVRDHRIVMRVGVFRDVEVLLHNASRIREKRPMGANARAEFFRLEETVRGEGDETTVTDLHLAMQLQEPLVLSPVFWAEPSASEHQYQRIASLQFRELTARTTVVGQLVVWKHGTGDNVASHLRPRSTWSAPSLSASSGVFPCSRATMYPAYHCDQ